MRHTRWCWLLCAALLLIPAVASADPWHWGLKTGLALTNLHGDLPDLIGPDNKLGFEGGGFVEFAPGPIAFEVGLIYAQKGATFTGQATDYVGNPTTFDIFLKLSYLEIPVLIRGSLPLEGAVKPYVVLGPTFGFAIDGEIESDFSGQSTNVLDDLEPMDLGATIGLGARIGSGPYRMLVEARYSTGFDDLWDISQNLESINHGYVLTVGVVH